MPDHIHAFIGLRPSMAITGIVRDIKNNSSNFINERGFVKGKFSWQEGYGVFSYSHSQIGNVYNYILNQENHHSIKTIPGKRSPHRDHRLTSDISLPFIALQ